MVGLEENDPLRFVLTQLHKSFGIVVLLLSVIRLLWRFTHRPPPEPPSIPDWQKRAAGGAHLALYLLMFTLPITGWIMVSASPLNLNTILFNVIPWPHLPPFADLPNKTEIAEAFRNYHEWAGMALILILFAHIGAALKHHFIDKDTVLVRMAPDWSSRSFKRKTSGLAALIIASALGLYVMATSSNTSALLAAGDSEVSFLADFGGEPIPGVFTDTSVQASIDEANPANSSIVARVQTVSLDSEDEQIKGTLPDEEWFDVANHPEAIFESNAIESSADGRLLVTGSLTIKTTTQEVSFPMTLSTEGEKRVARGDFIINRSEFDIGMESQDNEDFVGYSVTVKFRFDLAQPDG
jgi:cytochrome b561/polyisoprenoid-binding protein YceI